MRIALILSLVLLAACVTPTTRPPSVGSGALKEETERQREAIFHAFLSETKRARRVTDAVLRAGRDFCGKRTRFSSGGSIATAYDFPPEYRRTARSVAGIGDRPVVLTVAPGSPSMAAGLRPGDEIVGVNLSPLEGGPDASREFLRRIKMAGNKQFGLTVRRGQDKRVLISANEICNYGLALSESKEIGAWADGDRIIVSRAMLRFVDSDEELAFVVAHELAHNAMRHIDAKRTNALGGFVIDMLIAVLAGVDTQGMFTKNFAMAYSQEFESEADYVGLYMCELSGYDISEAAYWAFL